VDRFVGIGLVRPLTVRPASGVCASSLSRPVPPALGLTVFDRGRLAVFFFTFAGRRAVFLIGRRTVFLIGRRTAFLAAFTGRLALRALVRALFLGAFFVFLAFDRRAGTALRALDFAIFFLAIKSP